MSSKTRSLLLSLTIIAVIVFSTFRTTAAYADGGTTDDPPPTETTSTTEEVSTEATSAPTEATAETTTSDETSAEVTATEVTTTSEETNADAIATEAPTETTVEATATPEPVSTEASADTVTEEAATPAPTEESAPVAEEATPTADTSVLDAVPENTTVTVLDANGEAQPLATQEAAAAIATASDPVWCPSSVTSPTPGANGCTQSFNSFDALLTELATGAYTGAGTIYVEQGAYQGGESSIDFNAYSLGSISGSDLTITGGWNPADGTTSSANPTTFNDTSFVIGSSANPWGGSLTLYNLTMTFSNGATGQGLTLYSQNDINLSNISVTNAPDNGADLNAGRDVNIGNSKFIRNQTTGAKIRAGQNVAIRNVDVSNPDGARRQDTGLDIVAAGSVTLIDVLANNERLAGATINAGGSVTIRGTPLSADGTCPTNATCGSFFSGTKLIQGSDFLGYGLQVVTPLDIALANVTASNNFLWGASLQAGGNVAIADSIFNANRTDSTRFIDDTGLLVKSGGTVALNNVQASDNRLIGATIDAVGDVAINNGTFSNNNGVTLDSAGIPTFYGYGLQVVTQGNIAVNLVTASHNTLFGAHLEGLEVAVANSTFSYCTTNCSPYALGRGLEVISDGNVFLTNVTLDNNQTFGASIQAGGDIFLDTVTATNNGTDGVIILQGLCANVNAGTYSGNGGYGLNLGGFPLNVTTAPTFANNGSGDMFPTNPEVCALLTSTGSTASATSTTSSASNVFVSLQTNTSGTSIPITTGAAAPASTELSSANVTLKSVLTATATGIQLSIFTGNYVYIYSSAGLQIIALAPSSNQVAMQGPFRAY